ncbi:type IV toxin-antitoxin system AbiEi family antitoxin domain-containing protein [Nocardioides acrostichi]|uniref:type IV toxin-antitoxin system AbiEi family antitoxin domain-containing protein n=1 Tax=Nocardioides acrostichi TaxID=2784339 RepID=UPI001A9C561C|nr:hypothetical protein [Nocardioides acrostichi]
MSPTPTGTDRETDLCALLEQQDGVVSRRQLLGAGFAPHDLKRLLRRRELATMHPGVYVDHTGEPSHRQRCWAATLATGGLLVRESALPAASAHPVIHVGIGLHRSVKAPSGVRVHRMAHLAARQHSGGGPPRLRVEEAAVDVAAGARSDADALHVLADLVQTGRTTVERLREAALGRRRLRRGVVLLGLLDDLASGTCSVLERRYRDDVEQPHGLPRGRRQQRDRLDGATVVRDVDLTEHGLIVELDGTAFHGSSRAHARDLGRDLAAVVHREATTVRLGYRQVLDEPCASAAAVATVLRRGGWPGEPRRCPRCLDAAL